MHWAVIHHIHVALPHRHVARLIIEDVPDGVSDDGVKQAIVRAGRQPSEFGVPWANHYVAREDEWPDDVVRAYRSGEAPTMGWDRLTAEERKQRKVTLRLSPELHAALLAAAERRSMSLQSLCVEALERAVSASTP